MVHNLPPPHRYSTPVLQDSDPRRSSFCQGWRTAATKYGTWPTRLSTAGLALDLATAYSYSVYLVNGAYMSQYYQTDGVTVDHTSPAYGSVWDGYVANSDSDWQYDNDTLAVTWRDFLDIEAPIVRFEVTFGTRPYEADVVPAQVLTQWEPNVNTFSASAPLAPGVVYYGCVHAFNAAGLLAEACSDGVQVDFTPPECPGRVRIEPEWEGKPMATNPQLLPVEWDECFDPESGVAGYRIRILQGPQVVAQLLIDDALFFVFTALSLVSDVDYRVEAVALNGAGDRTTRALDGLRLYVDPPACEIVDGLPYGAPTRYFAASHALVEGWWRCRDDLALVSVRVSAGSTNSQYQDLYPEAEEPDTPMDQVSLCAAGCGPRVARSCPPLKRRPGLSPPPPPPR